MEIPVIIVGVLMFLAGFFVMAWLMQFRREETFMRMSGPRPKINFFNLPVIQNFSNVINHPIKDIPYLKVLQENAKLLRLPIGALEIMLVKELLMVGMGILVFVMISPVWGIVAALVGFMLPDILLNSKVNAKKQAMLSVFPETVDILDLCIGAGLDFLSALRWVVEKSDPNPFIEQLEVVLNEISVGKSRTEALKDMANRVKMPDINSFVRTIVQAERMGISIEEALRNLSEDTRATRYQRGERYAIKAGLKMLIPLMLCILPVILIIVAGPVIIQFTQGDLIPGGGVVSK
jgi:tight adherence protein C